MEFPGFSALRALVTAARRAAALHLPPRLSPSRTPFTRALPAGVRTHFGHSGALGWPGARHVGPHAGAVYAGVLALALLPFTARGQVPGAPPPITGSVSVTPDGGTARYAPNAGPVTQYFSVFNNRNLAVTYTMTCHASGVVPSCTPDSPTLVLDAFAGVNDFGVSFSVGSTIGTGQVSLKANNQATDTGWYNVTIAHPSAPTLSQPRQPDSVFNRAHCVTASAGIADWSCGDALFMLTTPSYTTLDRARSLTLTYASSTASPQPLVAVNVGLDATVLTHVTAVLAVQGTVQATTTYSPWTSATRQLVVGWNAASASTGAYPYTLTVYAVAGTDSASSAVSGLLYVVNRKTGPYGAGWEWLGVERLVLNQPVGSGLANILWVDGDGSAKVYHQVNSTTWAAPAEEYRDTIKLAGGEYTRTLRHGVQVVFDNTGRHVRTTNRQTQVTNFYWRSATQLDSVRVPPAGSGGKTFILHYNGSNVLDSVRVGGRDVGVTITSGQLAQWRWPDSSSMTNLAFHTDTSSGRIDSTVDARLGATKLHYTSYGLVDTAKVWFVDTTGAPVAAVTKYMPWQSVGYAGTAAGDTSKAFTSIIGPRGVGDSAEFHVDKWGAPIAILNPDHQLTKYLRGDANVPAMVTAIRYPNARRDTLVYNVRGNLTSLMDTTSGPNAFPLQRTLWAYTQPNDSDSPSQVTAPDHTVTTYTYNALGLTASVTDPRSHTTAFTYDTTTGHVSRGQLLSVSENAVPVWIQSAKVDSTRDLLTTLSYDALTGNTVKVQNPAGAITKYQRDATWGLITQVDNPVGFRRQYGYDRMGRVIRAITVHAIGDTTNACLPHEFVCGDSLIRASLNPTGTADTTLSTYTNGLLTQVRDPRGVTHTYRYELRGLLVAEVDETGTLADSVNYDRGGLVTSERTRDGDRLTFSYDAAGRQTQWTMPQKISFMFDTNVTAASDIVTSTYDTLGNLLVHHNRLGDVTRSYFENGALRTEARHGAATGPHLVPDSVRMAYDTVGRLDTLRWGPVDRVRYLFKSTGDLDTVFVDWQDGANTRHEAFGFAWDVLGRRQQVKYPYSSMSATSHYDRLGTLRLLAVQNTSFTMPDRFQDTVVQDRVDLLGRPLHQHVICVGNYSGQVGAPCGDWLPADDTTKYNRFGQVVIQALTGRAALTTDSFQYDISGNRAYHSYRGLPATIMSNFSYLTHSNRVEAQYDSSPGFPRQNRHFLYDSLGARRIAYAIDSTTVPPTNVPLQVYQYDAAGRMMGSGISHYPASVDVESNTCMYDPDGHAVQPCGAVAATVLGNQVIHDPNGNWFYVYGPGLDEPLVAIKRNTVDTTAQARLDMVSTGQGQLVAMADSAGGLNSAYAQPIPGSGGGPWGSGVAVNAQTFNPRRWSTPGQADTISTFRTRQYDPATGVWLQEDPIGLAGGINLYQYNGNDPNSFGDPFGLKVCFATDDKDQTAQQRLVTATEQATNTTFSLDLGGCVDRESIRSGGNPLFSELRSGFVELVESTAIYTIGFTSDRSGRQGNPYQIEIAERAGNYPASRLHTNSLPTTLPKCDGKPQPYAIGQIVAHELYHHLGVERTGKLQENETDAIVHGDNVYNFAAGRLLRCSHAEP